MMSVDKSAQLWNLEAACRRIVFLFSFTHSYHQVILRKRKFMFVCVKVDILLLTTEENMFKDQKSLDNSAKLTSCGINGTFSMRFFI